MKTVFKIIAKLISFIACFLEFAECVFWGNWIDLVAHRPARGNNGV